MHEKCCCPDCTAARHEFFAKLHPLMTKKEDGPRLVDSRQTLKWYEEMKKEGEEKMAEIERAIAILRGNTV